MKMSVSESTLAMLANADAATVSAAKTGVKALLELITENLTVNFKHGDAVQLAGLLVNGGISKHSAKRYADIAVMAVKAIQHQATLASSTAKPANKPAIKAANVTLNLQSLREMSDMRDIRAWSKEHGPKGTTEKATAPTAPTAPATATATAAPTATAVEAVGQLREVRETLAMLNAGQLTTIEALEAIAGVVGLAIAKPAAKPITPVIKTSRKTGT